MKGLIQMVKLCNYIPKSIKNISLINKKIEESKMNSRIMKDLIQMGKLCNYIPKSIKNISLINKKIEESIFQEFNNSSNKNYFLKYRGWVLDYIKEIVKQNIKKSIFTKLERGQCIFVCVNDTKKYQHSIFIKMKKDNVYFHFLRHGPIRVNIYDILKVSEFYYNNNKNKAEKINKLKQRCHSFMSTKVILKINQHSIKDIKFNTCVNKGIFKNHPTFN